MAGLTNKINSSVSSLNASVMSVPVSFVKKNMGTTKGKIILAVIAVSIIALVVFIKKRKK